jgi:hypothetical protein
MGDEKKISDEKLDDVLTHAESCFWMEVARMFPEVKTGDLEPGVVVPLRAKMREAIVAWFDENAPTPPTRTYDVSYSYSIGLGKPINAVATVEATSENEAIEILRKGETRSITLMNVEAVLNVDAKPPRVARIEEPTIETVATAITWQFTDPPMGQRQAAEEDWGAFVNVLPDYKGWTAAWEYPGYLAWHHKKLQAQVIAMPDWETQEEEILIDLQDEAGERVVFGPRAWDRVIPWPKSERNVETYMQRVAPMLDELNALVAEYRNATIRALTDAGFDAEGDIEVEEVPALCPISEELPGAWVTVQLWIDARDLTGEEVK